MIGVNPEEVPSEQELQMSETQVDEMPTENKNNKKSVIESFQKMLNRINNNTYYNERFN